MVQSFAARGTSWPKIEAFLWLGSTNARAEGTNRVASWNPVTSQAAELVATMIGQDLGIDPDSEIVAATAVTPGTAVMPMLPRTCSPMYCPAGERRGVGAAHRVMWD